MKGKQGWAVVFDFDGTLISKQDQALCVILMKHPLFSLLQPELLGEIRVLSQLNLERYRVGQMSSDEEIEWMHSTVEAIARHNIDVSLIDRIFSGVELRRGVIDCWEELRRRGIPVGIVSYGLAPFIRSVLKQNSALELVDSIMAQELVFDSSGGCVSWISETVVTPTLKGFRSLAFAFSHGVAADRVLAVGDSIGDINLGHLKKNRLGIGETPEDAASIAPLMGETVVTSDFFPVTEWLLGKIDQ